EHVPPGRVGVIVRERQAREDATGRVRIGWPLTEEEGAGVDNEGVLGPRCDGDRGRQVNVLFSRVHHYESGRPEQVVGRKLPQLYGGGAWRLEVKVKAGHIIQDGRERLTVLHRIYRDVGYRLLLIDDTVRAGRRARGGRGTRTGRGCYGGRRRWCCSRGGRRAPR